MFTFSMRIHVTPENYDRAKDLLLSIVSPTRAKRDCLGCYLCNDLEDTTALLYLEKWSNLEARNRHIRSHQFWSILLAMDLSSRLPVVRFDETISESGIEIIKEIRGNTSIHGVQTKAVS